MTPLRLVLAEHMHSRHAACMASAATDDQPEVSALGLVAAVSPPWWPGAAEEAAGESVCSSAGRDGISDSDGWGARFAGSRELIQGWSRCHLSALKPCLF